MLSFKSEDLPVIETVDHEDLVSAEETDENTSVTCFVRNSCLVREFIFFQERKTNMENTKKSNKKVLIGVIAAVVLVALVAIFAAVYFVFGAKPAAGSKAITIEVVNKAQESTVYEVKTDAEYLRQAMEEADGLTFSGAESEYGMMVDTVNGERADYSLDGAYWSFYVNGEYCNYGIDTQPVLDGDAFAITYTLAQ